MLYIRNDGSHDNPEQYVTTEETDIKVIAFFVACSENDIVQFPIFNFVGYCIDVCSESETGLYFNDFEWVIQKAWQKEQNICDLKKGDVVLIFERPNVRKATKSKKVIKKRSVPVREPVLPKDADKKKRVRNRVKEIRKEFTPEPAIEEKKVTRKRKTVSKEKTTPNKSASVVIPKEEKRAGPKFTITRKKK